jgi:hypothetical protein
VDSHDPLVKVLPLPGGELITSLADPQQIRRAPRPGAHLHHRMDLYWLEDAPLILNTSSASRRKLFAP